MSAKQYWHRKAHSPTILLVGALAAWLLSESGDAAIGYALLAGTLVVAVFVFVRVDRKNAAELDRQSQGKAELLKVRSTRTTLGLLVLGPIGLTVLIVLLTAR